MALTKLCSSPHGSSLLLWRPPQVSKPRGSTVAPMQPEEWTDLPPEADPADSTKHRGTCVVKSWDQRCSLAQDDGNADVYGAQQRSEGEFGERGAKVGAGSEEEGPLKMMVSSFL